MQNPSLSKLDTQQERAELGAVQSDSFDGSQTPINI